MTAALGQLTQCELGVADLVPVVTAGETCLAVWAVPVPHFFAYPCQYLHLALPVHTQVHQLIAVCAAASDAEYAHAVRKVPR